MTTVPSCKWLGMVPNISIGTSIRRTIDERDPHKVIETILVRVVARLRHHEVWSEDRVLPLYSPMTALRDAYDELTREGHIRLESEPIRNLSPRRVQRQVRRAALIGGYQISEDDGVTWQALDLNRLAELIGATPVGFDANEQWVQYRNEYACKVCDARPGRDGFLEHGKGCYEVSSEGGGLEDVAPTFEAWCEARIGVVP